MRYPLEWFRCWLTCLRLNLKRPRFAASPAELIRLGWQLDQRNPEYITWRRPHCADCRMDDWISVRAAEHMAGKPLRFMPMERIVFGWRPTHFEWIVNQPGLKEPWHFHPELAAETAL